MYTCICFAAVRDERVADVNRGPYRIIVDAYWLWLASFLLASAFVQTCICALFSNVHMCSISILSCSAFLLRVLSTNDISFINYRVIIRIFKKIRIMSFRIIFIMWNFSRWFRGDKQLIVFLTFPDIYCHYFIGTSNIVFAQHHQYSAIMWFATSETDSE